MNFKHFLTRVNDLHARHAELRYGQSLMNVLGEVWLDKYKEITATDYDCFYDDATVSLTLAKLEREWNEPGT